MDREGAVATVIVDRADAMNALDRPTLEELRDRLAEVAVWRDAWFDWRVLAIQPEPVADRSGSGVGDLRDA